MVRNRARFFTNIFFVVVLIDIIGIIINDSRLQIWFKPLIVLTLMMVYNYSVSKMNPWYVIALLFSLLGDVLLLDKVNYFLFGIAAFLMTQILFIKIIGSQLEASSLKQQLLSVLPFLVFYVLLMSFLSPYLGEFLYAVGVYGFVISVFGMVSMIHYLTNKKRKASKFLIVGALLFIASDSMIALNKFYLPKEFYGVAIMLTYALAQYFILQFMVKSDSEQSRV